MKQRFLHIIIAILLGLPLMAQNDYRPFKVDIGLLLGEVNKHHIGLIAPYVEPKYNINNHLTVGVRVEYTPYQKEGYIDYDTNNPYWTNFDAAGWNLSGVATLDYYFTDHFFRPFIGGGVGYYYMSINKENTYIESLKERSGAIGFVPRLGFNIGQFRLSCEYNFINSKDLDLDYLSLKVGYEIGGKKRWFKKNN